MLAFLLMICGDDIKEKIEHIYKTYHRDMLRYAKGQLKKMNDVNESELAQMKEIRGGLGINHL